METAAAPARKRRKAMNYPKCAWAGCGKNRSPRTLPFCGEHFRAVKAGETPPEGSLGTGTPTPPASAKKAKSAGLRITKGGGRKQKAA
jgi:hypothetical protein